ncbi:hypothetical protein [Azospirillum sp. TSO35-2]|uniref:hypothetical protein n=1 Tax=Azospirillum sp. TSO35-2 TaxID=716796 RepID=UPI0011B822B6|nr:hypothetical protein [Azospirillum sp. TSO35-2]
MSVSPKNGRSARVIARPFRKALTGHCDVRWRFRGRRADARRLIGRPPFGPSIQPHVVPPRWIGAMTKIGGRCTLYRMLRRRPIEFKRNYDPAHTALSAALLESFQVQRGVNPYRSGRVLRQTDASNTASCPALWEEITRIRTGGLWRTTPNGWVSKRNHPKGILILIKQQGRKDNLY